MVGDSKFIGNIRLLLYVTSVGSDQHLAEKSQLLVDVNDQYFTLWSTSLALLKLYPDSLLIHL